MEFTPHVQEEIDRLRSESDRLRTDANERMLEINSMLREKERWNERAMTAEIAKAAAEASVRAGKERCEELKVELEKANLEKARYVYGSGEFWVRYTPLAASRLCLDVVFEY